MDDFYEHEKNKLIRQYIRLIQGGKEPILNSARRGDSPEYEHIKRALKCSEEAMAMLEADFLCMDAAARAMDARGMSPQTPSPMYYSHPGRQNAAITIDWLRTHYEEKEGISLPRGAMFGHYLDYCQQGNLDPVNQASFGKIIRMVFPDVKTRRLGTRGQSKYHYYGLTIKESSPYKDIMVSAQRVNNYFGEPSGKGMYSRTVAQSSLTCSPSGPEETLSGSILLHEFPTASRVKFSDDKKDTVAVFLMMYRHHSQRVLDTVLRANFSEVKEFVTHFWQSLPSHIHSILGNDQMVQTIALCDSVLYKAIVQLLIPGLLQPLPSSLMMAIRTFGRDLISWLSDALKTHPSELRLRKIQVARRFSRCLWRQTALSHMASVARGFLHSADLTSKLAQDWQTLDIDVISKDLSRDLSLKSANRHRLQCNLEDFGNLFRRQISLSKYMSWIKEVYVKAVKQKYEEASSGGVQGAAREVLLMWSYVIKAIIRELTLQSADMFGPYHLMGLLFQDYPLFITEEWQREEAEHKIKSLVYEGNANEYIPDWEKYMTEERESGNIHFPPKYISPDKPFKFEDHPPYDIQSRRPVPSYPIASKDNFQILSSNYSSIPPVHLTGHCNLVDCNDEIVQQQNRAFDGDIDRTSPEERASSSRALDLSLNFHNSSFMDDDALVDKVISKGYATLDDCSNVLNHHPHPQTTWKQGDSNNSGIPVAAAVTTNSPMPPNTQPEILDGRLRFSSLSFSPSAPTHIYTSPSGGVPEPNYQLNQRSMFTTPPPPPPQILRNSRETMTSPYNPALYNTQSSNRNNEASSKSEYPKPARTPGYNAKIFSTYPGQIYTPLIKETVAGTMNPESPPNVHAASYTPTTDSSASQPFRYHHAYQFTHISGSLQVTPVNPRKKWLMEEELRSGILQSTSPARIQST